MRIEVVAVFAEGVDRVLAQRTERIQARDARALRAAAGFGVQQLGVRAEFAHVAEHQPRGVAARGERVDRGVERTGVRVVAVVDQDRAARQAMRDQAAGDRARVREAGGDHVRFDARAERDRCGRERVQHVVAAGHRQVDFDFADAA